MADAVECVVIGAGVVGLAVARDLARSGREVVVAESEGAIGTGTSSRNSEVIHAGIYYPNGSLKAETCVRGRDLLYAYCAERGIAHRRCGKLIVATSKDEIATLERIRTTAAGNGVTDLELIDGPAANAIEPAVACVAALHSPSTGIVDSHGLMLALMGEAEDHGAMIARHAPLVSGEVGKDGIRLDFGGPDPMSLSARIVINSAGLSAPSVARAIAGVPGETIPTARFARGNYFRLTCRSPFSRPIYPVPEPGGLGVHATLDLGGQTRFGPDVEWIDDIGFDVDPARAERFYAAIRRYWPDLPNHALAPDYAGVRPKIAFGKEAYGDFLISDMRVHGIAGLVNLFGIESPGLTAALALAEKVRASVGN